MCTQVFSILGKEIASLMQARTVYAISNRISPDCDPEEFIPGCKEFLVDEIRELVPDELDDLVYDIKVAAKQFINKIKPAPTRRCLEFGDKVDFSWNGYVFSEMSLDGLYRSVSERVTWRFRHNFYLTLNGKVLNREKCLQDYDLDEFRVYEIEVHFTPILGGAESKIVTCSLPVNNATRFEKYLIKHPKESIYILENVELQGFNMNLITEEFEKLSKIISQYIVDDDIASLLEDAFVFSYLLSEGYWKIASINFLKSRIHGSLSGHLVDMTTGFMSDIQLMLSDMLDMQGLEENVNDFRHMLDQWEDLKKSSVGTKYWKVINYMVRFGVFQHLGIHDRNAYKTTAMSIIQWTDAADFTYCLVDCISLTLQRALIWQRTGNWEVMLHGPCTYQKWFDTCTELKRNSIVISNLKMIGKDYFQYVNEVKMAIEQGESIVKYGVENKFDSKIARSMLNDMKILDLNILTSRAAQEERPAPFALLIYGGSHVAKSAFTKINFYAYGMFRSLPTGDEYRFVRDSHQEHWNGFKSFQWCLQLDDVAYMLPGIGVDESLTELIIANNNVPVMPNQAALEDKGKTPLRCELILATTNTKNLNAQDYFSCPLAVLRRLPWVITIEPKPEYAREDAPGMIDPSKIVKSPGVWMNVWRITIEKVVPGEMRGGRQMAKHVYAIPEHNGRSAKECSTFEDINLYLDWYKDVVEKYNMLQRQAMEHDDDMAHIDLCSVCNRPRLGNRGDVPASSQCTCELQADVLGGIICFSERFGTLQLTCIEKSVSCIKNANDEILEILLTDVAYGPEFCTKDGYFHMKYQISQNDIVSESMVPVDKEMKAKVPKSSKMSPAMQDLLDKIILQQIEEEKSMPSRMAMSVGRIVVKNYFDEGICYHIARFLMQWKCIRNMIERYLHFHLEYVFSGKSYFKALGKLREQFTLHTFLPIVAGLAALGAIILTWKVCKKNNVKIEINTQPPKDDVIVDEVIEVKNDDTIKINRTLETFGPLEKCEAQASEVADDYFEKNEKENVWKKVDLEVTSFDVDPMQVNYATLETQKLLDTVRRNVYRMEAHVVGGTSAIRGTAFCVGGYLFVTDNHLIKEGEVIQMSLRNEASADGVSSNITFNLDEADLYRMPEKDLVWFQCLAMPPRKDLSKLLAKKSFRMGNFRGNYVGRELSTKPRDYAVRSIIPTHNYCPNLDIELDYWKGRANEATQNGDCGTPLLVRHANQVVIVGLHQLGSATGDIYAIAINQDDFQRALGKFKRPLIQSGVPSLQAEEAPEKLLEGFTHKSPLNWVKSGSIHKYGHIRGSGVKPRSHVASTLLAEKFLHDREWECTFRAPIFDWRPYNHMYNDILGSKDTIRTSVLNQAIESFANDIIGLLPKKAKDGLKIISWEAALNGIDGVQYVDKMNFNSSMGFPWNKSKRYFLSEDPDTDNMKKTLPAYVWDRAKECERRYKAGVRACPVFSGQCKDEARPKEKVDAGKVRVFTGAPVDWSLCVRRYLLTFIKTVMENQTIFEAAPGCVAQSLEWEAYREYLTKFGLDRIVAGDYGKFDKRMVAKMIMAAFEVIIRVLKSAGWDDEEIKVVWGIAIDTAYPFTVIDGDLVEFFGSNPSGHPLTVIINSIVNALYMRYCYILLNPEHECKSFKSLVDLLTYGDDNAMGVSPYAEWFNHTAIQSELAKIGVEYTMADKKSLSVPFINIKDVSFLKRGWRWDDDVDAWLCPLDEKSIQKSLLINIPSKTISDQAQMIQIMNSAVNEWFFHGKEKCNYERDYLLQVVHECGLDDEYKIQPFPTWEEMAQRFKFNSKDVRLQRFGGELAPPEWLTAF
nr:MAG: hypothetical protein 1 [Locarnavirus sp.]